MNLKIDFWDVGQGDCSVVHLPDAELFIVDVGPPRSPLVDWLEERNGQTIDTIVITHNDEDHAGCLEHLLENHHHRINRVVILVDRDYKDPKMKRLMSCVIRHFRSGHIRLERLEASSRSTPLYYTSDGGVVIRVVHPDFGASAANLLRKSPAPNEVSGILCLDTDGRNQIVWPGDASMQTVAKVCGGLEPLMIVGPHHGAPIKRDQVSYEASFNEIIPENVFVSVGSHNSHSHPNKKFIENHVDRDRALTCSQLVHCDRNRYRNQLHVMNHHLLLGMLPPHEANAVTCRGPIQLVWNDIDKTFEFDRFHNIHRAKLAEVYHPCCVKRG